MSVVIVGGNDCMVRRYKDLCKQYDCQAKVFTQMKDGLKNKIGCPDLLVLFTSTMSHKMLRYALKKINVFIAWKRSQQACSSKMLRRADIELE